MSNINKYYKEKDYAEWLLKQRKLDNNASSDLRILGKYYISQDKSYKEVEKLLYNFCEKKYKSWFNKVTHYRLIDSVINYIRKPENKLVQIEKVNVSNSEIDYLESLNYEHFEKKILFSLLVFDKLKHEKAKIRGTENEELHYFGGSGEYSYKTLLDSLQEKITRTYREKGIHKTIKMFNDDGLTRTTQKTALELLFIKQIEQDKSVAIEINDFETIGLYYEAYNGNQKVKWCEECGEKLIKINSNKSKYCKDCFKYVKNSKNKEYYHLGK